ncbi:MAG: hypothetical protein AVDCRST_MAG56-2551 [uncultured Cytophagales bacterium]|uniref:Rhs-family protein n=1 Tax=uncultured Cytophagales bacterium TaxID=158755 RepID=A0A6J4IPH0_9SPHI|nr:MAG: hypothetical protein AVDCRST_MAG56-2551 [uncultured Cytophagales bacterium]
MKAGSLKASHWLAVCCAFLSSLISSCGGEDPDPAAKPGCRLTANEWGGSNRTVYHYDAKGNVIRKETTGPDSGKMVEVVEYQYNDKGQVILQTNTNAYGAGTETRTYTFSYNAYGQLHQYRLSPGPGVMEMAYESTCEYDQEGNRIKVTKVSTNNTPGQINTSTSVVTHEFKDGNLIRSTYDANSTAGWVLEYEYNQEQENKLRAFYLVTGDLLGPSPSKNMTKAAAFYYINDVAGSKTTYSYGYEFNEQGYPTAVHIATTNPQQQQSNYTYLSQYSCQ